jgi:hypothetical protein
MLIDTPLLVVGRGPAALVVAKVAAAYGLACLLVGHEVIGGDAAVPLGADAVAVLERHGLLDVLRPYLDTVDPPTVAPGAFEEVVKHHCVADLNVTVYDRMAVTEREPVGRGVRGVLTDGTNRWDVTADLFVDALLLPSALPAAIVAGAAAALEAVDAVCSTTPRPPDRGTC